MTPSALVLTLRRIVLRGGALVLVFSPMLVLLAVLNRSFDSDFFLVEKAVIAVVGLIAVIVSTAKTVVGEANVRELKSAVGWLVVSLLILLFVGLLKIALFDFWKGGFSADFSSDFDLAISKFWDANHKPVSWLRYVLFSGGVLAYCACLRGELTFVLVLLPNLRRYERWFA